VKRTVAGVVVVAALYAVSVRAGETARAVPGTSGVSQVPGTAGGPAPDESVIAEIKAEGFQHSAVMDTLSWLSDVHGPRLTGSPNLRKAAEWARDQLTRWGLERAALEPYGSIGRGWEQDFDKYSFVYNAAMRDAMLPRKPLPKPAAAGTRDTTGTTGKTGKTGKTDR
jgi:hypothetical protein